MATGDVFEVLRPRDFTPQNGYPQDPGKIRIVGPLLGYPLRKVANDGFYTLVKIPANGTPLSTGITVRVTTVDEPNNSAPGLAYVLGVSGVKLVSGTTNVGTVATGTETTATVTAAATNGIVTTTSFAITNANLATAAAGDLVLLYVRRIGTNAADTHPGEPLVLEVVVSDT